MGFIKLPANSRKLLSEIIKSENPVQMLCDRFNTASDREDDELRGILRELYEDGYIDTQWADNVPYAVIINNSGRTYEEQLAEYEAERRQQMPESNQTKPLRQRITEFIQRGERIVKDEYHVPAKNIAIPPYVTGPQSDKWFNDISIFNERHLSSHPHYIKIKETCDSHKRRIDAHNDMLGLLKSLGSDDEFFQDVQQEGTNQNGKSSSVYDVFISHASADKSTYVDELKESIDKLQVSVFYDTDSVEWGDKWKQRIMDGVEQAEFAIIVISEKFFGREWTEKELNEFLNRQSQNGQKLILPILHNITSKQLTDKYPDVADIQALNSSSYSCDEIALKFAGQLIKRLKG